MEHEPTPLRRQYLEIKRAYPNTILFFRLGDFYETFDDDAETIARDLEIVLTSRANMYKNGTRRVPMAGIPFHAVDTYIARLIEHGHHVAICEQTGSEPINGLVTREVIRVVTPGTIVEPGLLDAARNNYLAALVIAGEHGALAHADITTGHFGVAVLTGADVRAQARHELVRLRPAELLVSEDLPAEALAGVTVPRTSLAPKKFDPGRARNTLLDHFGAGSLAGLGLEGQALATTACAAVLGYVRDTQPGALRLLTRVRLYHLGEFMTLDPATRRNLELTETLRGGQTRGSLLGVLDHTTTPMGARLLRQWVSQPLLDLGRIRRRHDRVGTLHAQGLLRAELLAALKPLSDVERITNRIIAGSAQPRDLVALRETLAALPDLAHKLAAAPLELGLAGFDPCGDVLELLLLAIAEEPPAVLSKTGIIRSGYARELDEILEASRHAREWIAGLEQSERERTGIKTLKVGYNKVFGYYIEISRGKSEQAPADYIRKQTLTNAERYITPELKEYETLVLNAEERILDVETRLFKDLCAQIAATAGRLLATAHALAELDVFAALAETAARHNYTRPEIVEQALLEVIDGRHPVVEQYLEAGQRYVANDVVFEPGEVVRVITGPNMAGKSTYLRQAAQIVLLAQIGSFVPAASARLGLFDRIFTRIGAQDEIHAGQSTFMVEMVETANILHGATARSLLVLDEIGRGTSTYDGLSLAWAIVEHVHNHPGLKAKTLFATHYHELTDLAAVLPGVRNYNVAVTEEGERVIFLHKIIPGSADRSYGIHVAQLAGLPRAVIGRAQEILERLEASGGRAVRLTDDSPAQMALFPETNPLLDELKALDLNALPPMQALSKLFEWQARFR
ncbi:MAG: DNA mismatch repair protein MutS [Anaerolineales bacterium]|nr:DNA mismatch repair protein MutS [Anaerolineales bacterium]